jgi:hypothetical protein
MDYKKNNISMDREINGREKSRPVPMVLVISEVVIRS